jgi:hypothetical protein
MSDESARRDQVARISDVLWGHGDVGGLIIRVVKLEAAAHDFRRHLDAAHAVIVSPEAARAIEAHLADEARHAERRTWLRRMLGDRFTGLVFGLVQALALLYIAAQVSGK